MHLYLIFLVWNNLFVYIFNNKKIDTAFRYDVPVQKSYIATKLSLACVQPSSITSSSSFPMATKHLWFLIWGNMSLFALVAISLRTNPQATFQPVLLLWISQGLVGSWESKRIKKKTTLKVLPEIKGKMFHFFGMLPNWHKFWPNWSIIY